MTAPSAESVRVDPLVISLPDCPDCLVEVACDGASYWCEACGATWDMHGSNGQREAS